jgi:Na+-driven multidrug efflux pump
MGGISIWQIIIILIMLGLSVAWTLLLARIVGKADFNKWWTVISLVPLLNIIFVWVFAFSKWPVLEPEA